MGARQVQYHQGAVEDVQSAVAWYSKRNPRVALNFVEELRRAAEVIRQAPERWPLGKNNTRKFLLWRFPFAVIYSEEEFMVTIWAVAHASRRPEYWSRRL